MEDAINNKEAELTKMISQLKEAETSKLELEKMQQSNVGFVNMVIAIDITDGRSLSNNEVYPFSLGSKSFLTSCTLLTRWMLQF